MEIDRIYNTTICMRETIDRRLEGAGSPNTIEQKSQIKLEA